MGSGHHTWHHFPKILLNFIDSHSFKHHHCVSGSYAQLCTPEPFHSIPILPAVTVSTRDLNLVKLELVSFQVLLPLITSSLPTVQVHKLTSDSSTPYAPELHPIVGISLHKMSRIFTTQSWSFFWPDHLLTSSLVNSSAHTVTSLSFISCNISAAKKILPLCSTLETLDLPVFPQPASLWAQDCTAAEPALHYWKGEGG